MGTHCRQWVLKTSLARTRPGIVAHAEKQRDMKVIVAAKLATIALLRDSKIRGCHELVARPASIEVLKYTEVVSRAENSEERNVISGGPQCSAI